MAEKRLKSRGRKIIFYALFVLGYAAAWTDQAPDTLERLGIDKERAVAWMEEFRNHGYILLLVAAWVEGVRRKIEQEDAEAQLAAIADKNDETATKIESRIAGLDDLVRREPLDRTPPRALLTHALTKFYRPSDAKDLAGLVLNDDAVGVISFCKIEYTFKDEPGDSDVFLVEREITMAPPTRPVRETDESLPPVDPSEEYVIALTGSDKVADRVRFNSPAYLDTWYVADEDLLERNQGLILDDEKTYVTYQQGTAGVRYPARVAFSPIPPDSMLRVLGDENEDLVSEVRLFSAKIATKDRISVTSEVYLPCRFPYCYWIAERPTYVEEITFDSTSFLGGSGTPDFNVHAFMGAYGQIRKPHPQGRARGRYTIPVKNWVVKGQGAVFVWVTGP